MTQSHGMLYVCSTCGELAPAEAMAPGDEAGRCRNCIAQGKVIQWPGLYTDSESFRYLPPPDRLYQLARGYLHSAMSLCRDLGEHPDLLDWSRACVVRFCEHHAAELFLKACILLRAPAGEKLHHDVSKLQDRYCQLYPELKDEYHIETPWDIGLERAAEDFEVTLNIEDFEYKPDQVYRYMAGRDMANAKSLGMFSPGSSLYHSERLEREFMTVWIAVTSANKNRSPESTNSKPADS